MMAISPKTLPMLLTIACLAVLVPTELAQAQLFPPFMPGLPLPTIPGLPGQHCWSSLTSIPGCLMEIYSSFFRGQMGVIGPACCQAITKISDNCMPTLFPFNPFFPPLLKNSCAPPSAKLTAFNAVSKFGLPGQDVPLCWSSFSKIEGCTLEIYKSVTTGQFVIGPACCKAVTAINDNCWPKMFPFNPFFPPLLKSFCAKVGGAAPAPGAGTSSKPMPPPSLP